MRNYTQIDKYLDKLVGQIYPQPEDDGHTTWAKEAIDEFVPRMENPDRVLDVGCGTGFCQKIFEKWYVIYEGVCLGEEDLAEAKRLGRNVKKMDFTFLEHKDNSVNAIFSRHSLEHSPAPLLTLLEWKRVSSRYLAIVVPSPDHWKYVGQNHYYVLNDPQWRNLFDVAGFDVTYFNIKRQNMTTEPTNPEVEIEYWYLLEKRVEK